MEEMAPFYRMSLGLVANHGGNVLFDSRPKQSETTYALFQFIAKLRVAASARVARPQQTL